MALACMRHKGIAIADAAPKIPQLSASMIAFAAANVDSIGDGLEVLPGVRNTRAKALSVLNNS